MNTKEAVLQRGRTTKMKSRISLNVLACAVALACLVSTGCRKKPVGVTPLPGSRVVPGDVGQGGIMGAGGIDDQGITGTPMSSVDRSGWSQDRSMFTSETVHFDYDSSAIRESEKTKIETVAAYFKNNTSSSVALKVEGHCDERGTEEYNRALGERRALAIRDYLILSGVAGDRVDTVSFGEDKPVAMGHDESAWKQNRRGEFVVLTAP